ncbi:hypothetical protein ABNG02_13335 [Halorubrum ejinorense]|uniref:Uncharacterized protein n=1 Tax=Halorubrum ejinorense TaxID=425309 RepID=A0AAV3SXK4_9EURY
MNRNTIAASGLVLAVVVLLAGIAAGGVAADTAVDNGTVEVTNDTESAYADVSAVTLYSGAPAPNVTVVVEGVPNGTDVGNGTELLNETRTLSSGSVESFEYALNDTERGSYTRVHISVTSSGDGSLIESVDWGTIKRVSGGGSGGLGGAGTSTGVIVAVIVVVGAIYFGRED